MSAKPTLLAIVGVQRSGTSMLLDALGRSPDVEAHHETSPEVMQDFRLISLDRLRGVLSRSSRRAVVVKPLCDSQWCDHILANVDGSRAVWMVRRWADAVNSSTRMWPGHARDTVQAFRRDDLAWLGYRAERIVPATRRRFDELTAGVDDDTSCSAAIWWLRNRHFFDHGFAAESAVLRPMCYEALVEEPDRWLRRLADFVGIPFDTSMVSDVNASSVGRNRAPDVAEHIAAACDELHAALCASARSAWCAAS